MTNSDAVPDLILHHGLVSTLDRSNPTAGAIAITGGLFSAVGHDRDIMRLAGAKTRAIDLQGRRVLPGLIDNHLHIIRGGLNFNMELRWDGVRSLADAMSMLKRQIAVTPAPNGCAWWADSVRINLPKSGCRRLRRSMRSLPTHRCSCCICTTGHCSTERLYEHADIPRTHRNPWGVKLFAAVPASPRVSC